MEAWMADLLQAKAPAAAALPCKALPCFGEAVIPIAMAELAAASQWKQACLVRCIAETGLAGVPALLELSAHGSDAVRSSAFDGVGEALSSGLDSTSLVANRYAEVIQALENLRCEDILAAFDRLGTAMEDSDCLAIADEAVLAALMAGLDDPAPAVRISAMEAISRVEHDVRQSGQLFSLAVRTLADKDHEVRETAARYLRYRSSHELAPSSNEVGQLRRALADSRPFVRKTAARLLRALPGGPHAPEGLLRIGDREPDEPTPEQVVRMINRALTPASVPQSPKPVLSFGELLQNLRSPSVVIRVRALESLKKGQQDMAQTEDAILLAVHDSDIAVRLAAVTALDAVGSATAKVAWNLHSALHDSCLQVARGAQVTLNGVVLQMSMACIPDVKT